MRRKVAKLSSDGQNLIYSTLLGETGVKASSVAVDAAGNTYVGLRADAVSVDSAGIGYVAASSTSFIYKVDAAGRNLLFSTNLAGQSTGDWGGDAVNAVAVDAQGAIWLAGQTGAVGFPLANPIQASNQFGQTGYVARLVPRNNDYLLDFSTYLGAGDQITALALGSGTLWVAGAVSYGDFLPPITSSILDSAAFLARLDLPPLAPATPGVPLVRSLSNLASLQVGTVISPGELISLTGAELAPGTGSAPGFPLPLSLQGVSVEIGGIAAPLLYVSPTQINAQVPDNIPQTGVSIVVRRGGQASAPLAVGIFPMAPGIFMLNGDYRTPLIVHASDFTLVTPDNPAVLGEYLAMFCSGLGPTNPPAHAGEPAAATTITGYIGVYINGIGTRNAQYTGLAPGFAGLYQINFQLPSRTSIAGTNVLLLSFEPYSSGSVLMPPYSNQVLLYTQ